MILAFDITLDPRMPRLAYDFSEIFMGFLLGGLQSYATRWNRSLPFQP